MKKLNIKIEEQRNFECLPSCLSAVFDFYKIDADIEEIIKKISIDSQKLYDWEFKAGKLATEKGLQAKIYSNVSQIFDPSWIILDKKNLIEKLKRELNYSKKREAIIKKEPDQNYFIYPNKKIASRITKEIEAAIEFLENDGEIDFTPISKEKIESHIRRKIPIIASINPTLLHRMKRVYNNKPDDIRGINWGHVIVISGYDNRNFIINDPGGNFYKNSFEYKVNKDLLLESILRYNGQLLVLSNNII